MKCQSNWSKSNLYSQWNVRVIDQRVTCTHNEMPE